MAEPWQPVTPRAADKSGRLGRPDDGASREASVHTDPRGAGRAAGVHQVLGGDGSKNPGGRCADHVHTDLPGRTAPGLGTATTPRNGAESPRSALVGAEGPQCAPIGHPKSATIGPRMFVPVDGMGR